MAVIFVLPIVMGGTCTLWSSENPAESLTWVGRGAPTEAMDITEILVDPRDDAIWYVATETGLYVTWNAGVSWVQGIEGNIGAMDMDPNDANVVYASAGSELHWSRDQGLSWDLLFPFPEVIPGTPQDAPTFIDSILASTSDGTIVVGLSTTFHSARIYTSVDGGGIWDISFESPNGLHFWDLAEVPSNGAWFFCTEDSGHTVNSVVMRSLDRGATWEEMAPLTGVPTSGHGLNLTIHPWTEVVYFLAESSVLRYSVDFGESWSTTYGGRGFGAALLLDANCPNRAFGGEMVRGLSVGGVFVSEDSTQTFGFEGLDGHSVTSLAIDGASTKLFAAGYGTGLWEAEIGGLVCSQDVLLFANGFEDGGAFPWSSSFGW